MSEFLQSVETRRKQLFLSLPGFAYQTPEDALRYINAAGFCLFSHIEGFELPSYSRAAGPGADVWGWKDSLPAARQVFYGAIFHTAGRGEARPGFASLDLLAPLYSLSPVMQLGGDSSLLPRFAGVSREAVAIAAALQSQGSLSTGDLREATEMAGKANGARFSRALAEAQAQFLVSKVGVTSITRANYGYIWNTFERVFPETVQAAQELNELDAGVAILRQYLRMAIAVPLARISQVLAVNERFLRSAAAHLLEQRAACETAVDGVPYLSLAEAG